MMFRGANNRKAETCGSSLVAEAGSAMTYTWTLEDTRQVEEGKKAKSSTMKGKILNWTSMGILGLTAGLYWISS